MLEGVQRSAPNVTTVLTFGDQVLQDPRMPGNYPDFSCNHRPLQRISRVEYVYIFNARTHFGIDAKFLQKKGMAGIKGGEGQNQAVAPVTPYNIRTFPVAEILDMDVPGARFCLFQIHGNGSKQTRQENNGYIFKFHVSIFIYRSDWLYFLAGKGKYIIIKYCGKDPGLFSKPIISCKTGDYCQSVLCQFLFSNSQGGNRLLV
jgi:hypothetical protein